MSNSMTVYGAVPNAMEIINTMGESIAKSKLLGCENVDQGRVLAMTCLARSSDPMSLAQRYDIIGGRLSMKADAMLAGFRESGGSHRINQRDSDAAEIELKKGGHTQTFRLTKEDALQEPFAYSGKESETVRMIEAGNEVELKKRLKPKYASPRSRMQMLWARVASDSVRAMAPEIVVGAYTPEEISDFGGVDVDQDAVDAKVEVISQDGSREEIEGTPEKTGAAMAETETDILATGKQISRIEELFKALEVPADKQLAAIKRRGAVDMASLDETGADSLIENLEKLLAKASEDATGESKAEPEQMSGSVDGPCDSTQVDEMKRLLKEATSWPGGADVVARVKAKLNEHGLEKLADLSGPEAARMTHALSKKNLDLFFAESLTGHAAAKN